MANCGCNMRYAMRTPESQMDVCVDINLYLDTHPNDARALSDYNCYAQQLRALKDMYEKDFGPISNFGNSVSRDSWKWNTQPFPWHQKFMREE